MKKCEPALVAGVRLEHGDSKSQASQRSKAIRRLLSAGELLGSRSCLAEVRRTKTLKNEF